MGIFQRKFSHILNSERSFPTCNARFRFPIESPTRLMIDPKKCEKQEFGPFWKHARMNGILTLRHEIRGIANQMINDSSSFVQKALKRVNQSLAALSSAFQILPSVSLDRIGRQFQQIHFFNLFLYGIHIVFSRKGFIAHPPGTERPLNTRSLGGMYQNMELLGEEWKD